MSQFVILEHDHPTLHWDFMLARDGALCTWRLEAAPCDQKPIAALALAAHRLAYLDYEGPVSGARGKVMRWDRGEFEVLAWRHDCVEVTLAGARLHGAARLQAGADGNWTFVFTADLRYAPPP